MSPVAPASSQSLMRDTIVTVEVALSLLLLVAAGVMAQTLYEMQRRPLGFNPEKVVTAELMMPQKGYWFVFDAGPANGTEYRRHSHRAHALAHPALARRNRRRCHDCVVHYERTGRF